MFRKIQTAWKRFYHRLYRKIPFLRELQSIRQDADRLRIQGDRLLDLNSYLFTNLALNTYQQLLAADPRQADPKRLARHGLSVNSQNGEDGIIDEIFRRIGTTDRVFVEIGIGDGLENNTAFLLSQGWRGFWVDGNEAFIANIQPALVGHEDRLQWRTRYVDRENIAGVLGEMAVPGEFDLLSLDIDQNTLFVWEGLASFRPRVAVIEYNAAIPPRVDWSVRYDKGRAWDGSQNYGASLKAFERVGAAMGYRLVGCDFNGVNAFFVRADLVGDHFAGPYTAENHFEPPRFSLIHRSMHRRGILDLPG